MRLTQKQRVLHMLERAGERGVLGDEFYGAHMPRFAARIDELRKEGHRIATEQIARGRFRYTLLSPQTLSDPVIHGTAFRNNGKRVDPADVVPVEEDQAALFDPPGARSAITGKRAA